MLTGWLQQFPPSPADAPTSSQEKLLFFWGLCIGGEHFCQPTFLQMLLAKMGVTCHVSFTGLLQRSTSNQGLRHLLCHNPGGWTSKVKFQQSHAPSEPTGEGPFPARAASGSPSLSWAHGSALHSSQWVLTMRVPSPGLRSVSSVSVSNPLPCHKDTSHIGLAAPHPHDLP